MSTIRAFVTFVFVAMIVLLAIFQMDLRGYQEVARINEFVLYEQVVEECKDQLYYDNAVEYRIACENQYVLKSGFTEYSVIEGLEAGVISLDEIETYVTIE